MFLWSLFFCYLAYIKILNYQLKIKVNSLHSTAQYYLTQLEWGKKDYLSVEVFSTAALIGDYKSVKINV